MGKTQQLQQLVDSLKTDYHFDWQVKKKGKLWYLVCDEARYFGDKGESMGETFEEAVELITNFLR